MFDPCLFYIEHEQRKYAYPDYIWKKLLKDNQIVCDNKINITKQDKWKFYKLVKKMKCKMNLSS